MTIKKLITLVLHLLLLSNAAVNGMKRPVQYQDFTQALIRVRDTQNRSDYPDAVVKLIAIFDELNASNKKRANAEATRFIGRSVETLRAERPSRKPAIGLSQEAQQQAKRLAQQQAAQETLRKAKAETAAKKAAAEKAAKDTAAKKAAAEKAAKVAAEAKRKADEAKAKAQKDAAAKAEADRLAREAQAAEAKRIAAEREKQLAAEQEAAAKKAEQEAQEKQAAIEEAIAKSKLADVAALDAFLATPEYFDTEANAKAALAVVKKAIDARTGWFWNARDRQDFVDRYNAKIDALTDRGFNVAGLRMGARPAQPAPVADLTMDQIKAVIGDANNFADEASAKRNLTQIKQSLAKLKSHPDYPAVVATVNGQVTYSSEGKGFNVADLAI